MRLCAGLDPSFKLNSNCPSGAFYPFPASPTGTFEAALSRGTINIGYNAGVSNDLTPSSLLLIDTSTNPPTGLMVQFLNNVTAQIALAYGRQFLTLSWTYCATSDICFDMLQSGA